MIAGDLKIGDRFVCGGKVWEHCGWRYDDAVEHVIAQEIETKERRIISRHEVVKKVEVKDDTPTVSPPSVSGSDEEP